MRIQMSVSTQCLFLPTKMYKQKFVSLTDSIALFAASQTNMLLAKNINEMTEEKKCSLEPDEAPYAQ